MISPLQGGVQWPRTPRITPRREWPIERIADAMDLYWQASNRIGPEWATDYLSAPVCDWTALDRSPHI